MCLLFMGIRIILKKCIFDLNLHVVLHVTSQPWLLSMMAQLTDLPVGASFLAFTEHCLYVQTKTNKNLFVSVLKY